MPAIHYYADSADRESVGSLLREHLVAGVTTNPTILARSGLGGRDIHDLYAEWEQQGAREIFFQAWGDTTAELVAIGRSIAALGDRAVVKVPASAEGFPAAATLAAEGASVLITAVYGTAQAVAASAAGARYIAPYLGRLEDAGRNGLEEIAAMQGVLAGTGTDVLVASLRSPAAIVSLAQVGIRYFTAAPAVLRATFENSASDAAVRDFAETSRGWTL